MVRPLKEKRLRYKAVVLRTGLYPLKSASGLLFGDTFNGRSGL